MSMMTERCRNCEAELRLARLEKCDVERVEICDVCGRVYLGHPEEMLITFPVKEPVRRKVREKVEEMTFN